MKVTKWVEFEKEVEIEIGADDIRAALADLAGSPERVFQANAILNAVAQSLRGIPNDLINEMSSEARATVAAFLGEQKARFENSDRQG